MSWDSSFEKGILILKMFYLALWRGLKWQVGLNHFLPCQQSTWYSTFALQFLGKLLWANCLRVQSAETNMQKTLLWPIFFWPMTSKQETSWRMPPEKESIASSFDDSSRLVLVSCYCEAFFQKFLLGAMGFAHEVVDLEMDAKVANSQLMEKHMGRVPEAPTGPMPSLPPKTSSMKASDSQKEKINLESRGSCDFQPMIAFKASSAVEKFMVRDVRQDICHFCFVLW